MVRELVASVSQEGVAFGVVDICATAEADAALGSLAAVEEAEEANESNVLVADALAWTAVFGSVGAPEGLGLGGHLGRCCSGSWGVFLHRCCSKSWFRGRRGCSLS